MLNVLEAILCAGKYKALKLCPIGLKYWIYLKDQEYTFSLLGLLISLSI